MSGGGRGPICTTEGRGEKRNRAKGLRVHPKLRENKNAIMSKAKRKPVLEGTPVAKICGAKSGHAMLEGLEPEEPRQPSEGGHVSNGRKCVKPPEK